MDDDTFHICELCRERIDPDAPDTVRAVQLQKTVAMGPTVEYLEGLGVFFHEHHYPTSSPNYRRKNQTGVGAAEMSVVASLKVRVSSGCFHREHSPHAYALIDQELAARRGDPTLSLIEHENGPELLVALALVTTGLGFAKSVIDLVVAIVKARAEGIRRGDHPSEPVELIVRRFDGRMAEETILRIRPHDSLDRADLERRLDAAVKRIAEREDAGSGGD